MRNYHWLIILIISACKSTSNTTVEVKIEPINNETKRISSDKYIWYHPNEWWKIDAEPFPVSKDSFEYRMFFAQYGNPPRYEINSWKSTTWTEWVNYNGFHAPKYLQGHAWNGFIMDNKAFLEKNPELIAEIDGKRPGITITHKLCVTNPTVQSMYTEYLLARALKQGNDSPMLGVEPSDGAKYCTCKNCLSLGSLSNQIFYFANVMAKNIKKVYPKGNVNLLAYYTHIDPPTFPLEKNVYVTVISGNLQNSNSPEFMMKQWKEKTDNLVMYEYFQIPQWRGDLPRFEQKEFFKRAQFAKTLNYKGFWHEAGANIMATINLGLFNTYFKNTNLTWDEIFNKFIADCFPHAQEDVKRMFTRWNNTWLWEKEINASLYDLNEASKKIPLNSDEAKRLNDLKAYIHYTRLYLEQYRDKPNLKKKALLLEYIYKISDKNIVHVNAISQVVLNGVKDTSLVNKYTFLSARVAKAQIKCLTFEEIEKNFQADLKLYPPRKIEFKDEMPLETIQKMKLNDSSFIKQALIHLLPDSYYSVYAEKPIEITCKRLVPKDSTNKKITITISSSDWTFINSKDILLEETWKINLPKKDIYKISFHKTGPTSLEIKGSFIGIIKKEHVSNWSLNYLVPTINNKFLKADKTIEIEDRPQLLYMIKDAK